MKKVFLSYSRDGADYAHRLAKALSRRAEVVDPAQMQSASDWSAFLRHQLMSADAMVLVLGKDALHSKWLQFEVGAAVGLSKPVYAIALDQLNADLADYLLRDLHVIDAKALTPEDVASRIDAAIAK